MSKLNVGNHPIQYPAFETDISVLVDVPIISVFILSSKKSLSTLHISEYGCNNP